MKAIVSSYIAFVLLIASTSVSKSQDIEVGLIAGAANYYGDLNANFGFNFIRPSAGFMLKQHLNQYISIKGTASYGRVGATDNLQSPVFEQTRNLSFRSDIFELAGQVELNFFRYELQNLNHYFTPYLTTGAAVFRFNPKTELDGEMIELQPIGTEGQMNPDVSDNFPYKLSQFAIPMGLGFKYWVGGNWTVGGEVTYRKTFTDYVDDVSDAYVDDFILGPVAQQIHDQSEEEPNTLGTAAKQRGNRISTDDYMFAGVFITRTFSRTKCPSAQKGKNASLRSGRR